MKTVTNIKMVKEQMYGYLFSFIDYKKIKLILRN